MLIRQKQNNVSELCRRFGVSRKTAYKWLRREAEAGAAGLTERSRRPRRSPKRTRAGVERQIIALRRLHPVWGGRKLRRRLGDLGGRDLPAPSTVSAILRREGLLEPSAKSAAGRAWQRFARAQPNELWQMDFKGHVPCRDGRCHPLTILDDHSRYALALAACANERGSTVQAVLTKTFRHYGLPWQMLMDNGSPWGDDGSLFTWLTVWLMRLGIQICHGRPYHPQTQGKEERFHRTLKAELLGTELNQTLAQCQPAFDRWRHRYNYERPHEALALAVPARHYQVSARAFPQPLPAIEYGPTDQIRQVQVGGWISFQGRNHRLSKALRGQPVALRPSPHQDGLYAIFFCRQSIGQINLQQTPKT